MMGKAVEATGLNKAFQTLRVLNGISFDAFEGETVTFLGPSGSGKTTLLDILTGVDNNYEGTVKIFDVPQHQYLNQGRIACVTQKYGNFPWLTVKENISLGAEASVDKTKTKAKVDDIIEKLDLAEFINYYPSQLSGGMQQRVAIGRAIAQDTPIMAMDEPFGALDYLTRKKMQEFLKQIQTKFRKTILFITHDIEEAIYISDRIYVLSQKPTRITEEYIVPEVIKTSNDKNLRYTKDFIELRQKIENTFENGN